MARKIKLTEAQLTQIIEKVMKKVLKHFHRKKWVNVSWKKSH